MGWIAKFLNLKFLLYSLILFFSLPIVFSTLISPGKVVIDFVPNKVYTFGLEAFRSLSKSELTRIEYECKNVMIAMKKQIEVNILVMPSTRKAG